MKIIHNKMLGGWYVVRGKHQTPISGRFDSCQEAINWLDNRKQARVQERGREFFSGLREKGGHRMKLIQIPRRFFDDHMERDLDTPEIVKSTRTNYWIRSDDPAIPELRGDADWYTDRFGPGESCPGLRVAAHALLRALDKGATA